MKSKRKRASLFLACTEATGSKLEIFDRDLVVISDNFAQEDWDEMDELREELIQILLEKEREESFP